MLRSFCSESAITGEVVARSSITTAGQVAINYAAIIMFGTISGTYLLGKIIFVAIVSAIFGVLFFYGILGKFEDQVQYSFPMVKPRVDLFNSLQQQKTKNKKLFVALGLTFIYSFFVNVIKKIPAAIKIPMAGEEFCILNNPLLVAIGCLIGYQRYLIMGLGFVYSLVIYLLFKSGSFSNHLMNPFIYSVVISFIVTQGLITTFEAIKKIKLANILNLFSFYKLPQKDYAAGNGYHISLLAALGFIIFNGLIFSVFGITDFTVPFWVLLIIIPITLVSAISTLQGVAETGFWFSALGELLPILIVLLSATRDVTTIIMIAISLMAFETSGIYFVINTKLSRAFRFSYKDNLKLNLISIIVAITLSVYIVNMLHVNVGLGTQALPIPFAKALGMTIKGMVDSLETGVLPEYLNHNIVLIACLVCLVLNKIKLSPMVIIGGLLLPFGIYLTLGIGAILSFILRKQIAEQRVVFSGMATADGFISTLSSLMSFRKQ